MNKVMLFIASTILRKHYKALIRIEKVSAEIKEILDTYLINLF